MPRPMIPRGRETKEPLWKNDATYIQYVDRLTELSISMFKWENLPKTVSERFMEYTLFGKGAAVFFKDPDVGDYYCLPVMLGGQINIYNIPTIRTAYAASGYNCKLNEENSVIIYNNMLRKNSVLDVEMFAKRLYELDRAIDVNVNAQKTPVLIACEESQRLTLKNLYMQYEGNMPVIFGEKAINPNVIKAINTGAPYVADRLYQLKTQRWNEALTYLGISNVNYQKKERLISDEVLRGQGGIIASRYSRLNARNQACEEINDMFGLDISCSFREDYREADDEIMFAGESGDKTADTLAIDLRTE